MILVTRHLRRIAAYGNGRVLRMPAGILSLLFCLLVATAPAYSRQTVGLVLSGGGAKGVAHVGVIKALEENGIPIDYVAGTSMGAVVGSMYCCGWSPERMIDFITSPGFHYWSTGTIDKNLTYYFSTPRPTPQWLRLNVNFKDSTTFRTRIIPSSLISPIPMNFEFLKLYTPYTKQCSQNFDNLFVPFRCVTSDVYHKRKIVCRSGSLGDAVRASMSFPMVFKPIEMDGVLVYDGGIYDNFPVDVMRDDFKPDIIIGVSVASPDHKPMAGNIYQQVEDMIIQNNDYSLPADEGIKIQVPVLGFGVLDFPKSKEIYDIGYRTGLEMIDSIKKRVTARVGIESVTERRRGFAGATPEITFDSVSVSGAAPGPASYLRYLFDRNVDRPVTMEQAQDAYYQAVTDGKLSDLLPQARFGKGDNTTLLLKANVKPKWYIGAGGWITSSTHSMLYLDLGYHTLSFNSLDVDLSGWIGQSYYAGKLSGKFALRTKVPTYMQAEIVVSRQKYFDSQLLFYQDNTPTFISDHQAFMRLNYCMAAGRKAVGYVSAGYGFLWDYYYENNYGDFAHTRKDLSQYRAAVLKVGFDLNTLNHQLYPSSGRELSAYVMGDITESRFVPAQNYKKATDYHGHSRLVSEVLWRNYFQVHRNMTLGVMANGMLSLFNPYENYTAALVNAPAFEPTPSTKNYFNIAFRSPNYLATGVMPVWSPVVNLQLRGDFYLYAPVRNIVRKLNGNMGYDGWFRRTEFIGEIAAVYNFPFASISVYGNYLTYPRANWNFGINFGLLFQAPRLIR